MNSPYTLQRWSSIAHTAHGAELLPAPLSSDAFARALSTLATDETRDFAFLVIKVLADSEAAFQSTIQAANATTIEPRLCLAVNCTSLEAIDLSSIDNHHVGIMLDDVDADTPLSSIANGSIEAIRFRSEFVASASQGLRLGCVLESMLLLAHNLGLSTLGPPGPVKDDVAWPAPKFDYTPSLRPMPSTNRPSAQAPAVSTGRMHPPVRH